MEFCYIALDALNAFGLSRIRLAEINVLKGEMSLVGPRPLAVAHDNHFEKLLQDYAFRHHVKPDMTGWAQLNGLSGSPGEGFAKESPPFATGAKFWVP